MNGLGQGIVGKGLLHLDGLARIDELVDVRGHDLDSETSCEPLVKLLGNLIGTRQ